MNNQEAEALVRRYNQGIATPEESIILERWYLTASSQQTLSSEIDEDLVMLRAQLWRGTLHRAGLTEPAGKSKEATENNKIRQQSTLDEKTFSDKIRWPRLKRHNQWYKTTAAAMLLIAGMVGYIRTKNQIIRHSSNHDFANIRPGRDKAMLTLANGRRIIIDSANSGTLSLLASSKVIKNTNGSISYQPNANISFEPDSYDTLVTPKGGKFQLMLSDGTKVWLNAQTKIRYPEVFSSRERTVELIEGEAYFEVRHVDRLPFKVIVAGQIVKDIGTHFNINAYPDEPTVVTTLLEGKIVVQNAQGNTSKYLMPGEKLVKYRDEMTVILADTEAVMAWKNGDFIFKDDDFKTAMRKIARWYDVEIIYDPSAPTAFVPGGWISRSKNISSVLKIMESTGNVHFKIKGRRIIVTR